MRSFALALALGVVAACGRSSEPAPSRGSAGSAAPAAVPGPADVVTGELLVNGERLAIARCNPQHDVRTFLELETAKGVLRFKEATLFWNDEKLTCERLDRSWGGGVRADGTAYWRGTLDFACGAVTGKVDADCGRITAEERSSLDANRKNLREEQARDKQMQDNAGSAPPPPAP